MNKYNSGYDFDAVVIGAGIAGLTTGAYLARQGIKVLVCEQFSRPGGYFTSFKYKGYTFDGGIQACENLGILIPMLRQLGVLDHVKLQRSPVGVALVDAVFPVNAIADIDNYYDFLARKFPSQAGGLKMISKDTRILAEALEAYSMLPNPLYNPLSAVLRALPGWAMQYREGIGNGGKLSQMMKVPMEHYLNRHLSDPNLIRLFLQTFPRGTPVAFGLGYIQLFVDYYYAHGGMQKIAEVLAQYLQEHGGELKLQALVEKIMLENGRACGVKLQSGEGIRAPFIISAGDAKKAMLKMLPEGVLPDDYRRRLAATEVSESSFRLFLGVDIPPEQLPLKRCEHLFPFAPNYEGISYDDVVHSEDFFRRAPQVISVPCLNDPSLAPPGKSGIIINVVAVAGYADNWGTKNGRRTPAYKKLKEKTAAEVLANTEKLIPGLSRKIDFKLTATPYTLERFTLNSGGSLTGWNNDPQKTFHNKSGNYLALGHVTPIKNLFQVGHWAFFPGGAPSGMIGGKLIADLVSARIKYGI